jgi:hypothetical protein
MGSRAFPSDTSGVHGGLYSEKAGSRIKDWRCCQYGIDWLAASPCAFTKDFATRATKYLGARRQIYGGDASAFTEVSAQTERISQPRLDNGGGAYFTQLR